MVLEEEELDPFRFNIITKRNIPPKESPDTTVIQVESTNYRHPHHHINMEQFNRFREWSFLKTTMMIVAAVFFGLLILLILGSISQRMIEDPGSRREKINIAATTYGLPPTNTIPNSYAVGQLTIDCPSPTSDMTPQICYNIELITGIEDYELGGLAINSPTGIIFNLTLPDDNFGDNTYSNCDRPSHLIIRELCHRAGFYFLSFYECQPANHCKQILRSFF